MKFVTDSIFTGTCGITAVLLVMQLIRLKLQIRPAIIISVSTLLLFGSLFYFLRIAAELYVNYYSNPNYGSFKLKNGNLWLLVIMLGAWPFTFGLLPQFLWLKKRRQRLWSLVFIVGVWAVTRIFISPNFLQFFIDPLNWHADSGFSTIDYLLQAGAYSAAFAVVHYFISKKDNDDQTEVDDHESLPVFPEPLR